MYARLPSTVTLSLCPAGGARRVSKYFPIMPELAFVDGDEESVAELAFTAAFKDHLIPENARGLRFRADKDAGGVWAEWLDADRARVDAPADISADILHIEVITAEGARLSTEAVMI